MAALKNLYGNSVQVFKGSQTCTETLRGVRSGGNAREQPAGISVAVAVDRTIHFFIQQARSAPLFGAEAKLVLI